MVFFEWILVSPLLFLPFSYLVFAGTFFCRSLVSSEHFFFCRSLFFLPLTFPSSFSGAHYFFRLSIFFDRSLFSRCFLFSAAQFFRRSLFLQLTLSFLYCKWFDTFSRYSLFSRSSLFLHCKWFCTFFRCSLFWPSFRPSRQSEAIPYCPYSTLAQYGKRE